MKRLVDPPPFRDVFDDLVRSDPTLAIRLLDMSATDGKGRYLAWDQLRHRTPPAGLSVEQWWAGTRMARRKASVELPITGQSGRLLTFCLHNAMTARLHRADKHAAGDMTGLPQLARKQTRESYLIRSLIIEAVNSSQLEGASTTTPVAKKMITTGRQPRDKDERMIVNNYRAMQFIREQRGEDLTLSAVLEMHGILTDGTLDDVDASGRFRTAREELRVVDNRSQETLHVPPPADEIADRMESLIRFANETNDEPFIHPVVRAIALHFSIGFVHPFVDGNGRTARALFYWCMARHDYWLAEFVSISGVLKRAFAQYGKAYMRTETDEDDLTFFIDHQLDVLEQAISDLQKELYRKADDYHRTRDLIESNDRLKRLLNARQQMLIQHALEHPGDEYTVREHQHRHAVAYETARKDLFALSDDLRLLEKTKRGKTFSFFVPSDLLERLERPS